MTLNSLVEEVKRGPVPLSIGIIMDGNRRFAREVMKKPSWWGHKFGVVKARDVLKWACEIGIKYITVYALSFENLKSRPKKELQKIFEYLEKEMDDVLYDDRHVVHKTETRVKFIGRIRLLPGNIRKKIKEVESLTKKYKKHFLNIALAYGGQQEIVDAFKKISKKIMKGTLKPSDINEKLIKENLYTNGFPYPDLIIRTGGEKRLSNFLPWQSAYSELAFTDKKWPEFDKRTFLSIIKDYQRRERRFGR
ncbi:MAG: di-trans,poly-cis-decaprenylcistransferase [Candidatus Aenigmarchaeota archaeon]|nr:di-trans,poly-cis-decaprenylcistransferase [Candidatus Aenigmarchaeota archaeon]